MEDSLADEYSGARVSRQAQRREFEIHWQIDTSEPLIEERPWKKPALQDEKEALPPMNAEELKRAASSCRTSTRVGSDGFHPRVP